MLSFFRFVSPITLGGGKTTYFNPLFGKGRVCRRPLCRNWATFRNFKTNLSWRDSLIMFTSSLVKFHPLRNVPSCFTILFGHVRAELYNSVECRHSGCRCCKLWFLPRDALPARSMPLCGVRPSVRPSVTYVNSVKTSNRIYNFFSLSGSHTIVVFSYQTSWQYSDGDPPNECSWRRQKSRFWADIRLHCVLSTLRRAGCYQVASCDTYRW